MGDSLNFLSNNDELSKWYGNEFSFYRNPFLLPVTLEQRPKTPREATRIVIIGGERIEQVSDRLAIGRKNDLIKFEQAWEKIQNGPTWWPKCTREEWIRIRKAESIILMDENYHKKKLRKFLL